MNVGSAFNGGGVAGFGYPIGESSEIQVTIAGGLGEIDRRRPRVQPDSEDGRQHVQRHRIPEPGRISGRRATISTTRCCSYGLTTCRPLIKNWDTNFAIGGPIVKDRLWFFNNVRSYGNHQEVPGLFGNTERRATRRKWTYVNDESLKARAAAAKMIEAIRLTGQATPRNKVGFYLDYQSVCNGSAYAKGAEQCRDRGDDWVALGSVGAGFFGALAPESGQRLGQPREDHAVHMVVAGHEQAAARSRILASSRAGSAVRFRAARCTDFIPVQEQSTLGGVPVGNFTYRGWASAGSNEQFHNVWRASGDLRHRRAQHEDRLPGGVSGSEELSERRQSAELRLQQHATPIQFTLRDAPFWQSNRTRFDAIYAQDQWTRGRLTLQGGVRYEHAWSWFPEGENGDRRGQRSSARRSCSREPTA